AREIEQDSVRVGDLVAADQLHVTRLDDSVLKAMQIMADKGVHRLPVVDARGELAGIVSSDEMLSLLSRYLESMSELSRRARSREARMRA
ncbi:MAG: CBS domain-containing protein, partial [Gammaproteobacteria bacterium]|nr:CBS domain-containing protein [Gammaproteobacteria bacterium]